MRKKGSYSGKKGSNKGKQVKQNTLNNKYFDKYIFNKQCNMVLTKINNLKIRSFNPLKIIINFTKTLAPICGVISFLVFIAYPILAPEYPDFRIHTDSPERVVNISNYNNVLDKFATRLCVEGIDGYNKTVRLSYKDLPKGFNVDIYSPNLKPGFCSDVEISMDQNLSENIYTIIFVGKDDDNKTKKCEYIIRKLNSPPKLTSLIPDKNEGLCLEGFSVVWKASAYDPDNNDTINYKFWISDPTGKWIECTKDWTCNCTWIWDIPINPYPGIYNIKAWVRDQKHKGPSDYDDEIIVSYNITCSQGNTSIASISVFPQYNATSNTTDNVTCNATDNAMNNATGIAISNPTDILAEEEQEKRILNRILDIIPFYHTAEERNVIVSNNESEGCLNAKLLSNYASFECHFSPKTSAIQKGELYLYINESRVFGTSTVSMVAIKILNYTKLEIVENLYSSYELVTKLYPNSNGGRYTIKGDPANFMRDGEIKILYEPFHIEEGSEIKVCGQEMQLEVTEA